MTDEQKPKRRPGGFAVMDPKLVKEISSKGGKASHAQGTAHEWAPEEARAAGRLGGIEMHRRRREGPRDTIPDLTVVGKG